jgi:hypothetical protein
MRSFVVLGFLAVSAFACAAPSGDGSSASSAAASTSGSKVLVDCNVFLSGGGPDQQVTIVKTADGLILKELDANGSMKQRPLSDEEYQSGKITLTNLPDDFPNDVATFYKSGHSWMYKSSSALGDADCADTSSNDE